MLAELRSQVLLDGFRGHPKVDRDALAYTIHQFSLLLAEHPEILEMDLNPMIWNDSQNLAIAVDYNFIIYFFILCFHFKIKY